jgi:hypothetical protein
MSTTERLTKSEIDYLLRALRANVKAAKSAVVGLEAKLRAEFEEELNRRYPLGADPVWQKAFDALMHQYEKSQAQVDRRCDELNLPRRFRPAIMMPSWHYGGAPMKKELRAELRRVAYAQIKLLVQERVEEQERESARIQLEIMAEGCVTPTAKAFLDSLPKVDQLIKPLSAAEVFRLMEGQAHLTDVSGLHSYLLRHKPEEYGPDLDFKEDEHN